MSGRYQPYRAGNNGRTPSRQLYRKVETVVGATEAELLQHVPLQIDPMEQQQKVKVVEQKQSTTPVQKTRQGRQTQGKQTRPQQGSKDVKITLVETAQPVLQASIHDTSERIPFHTLKTYDNLKFAVTHHLGFPTMTPIQSQVIPVAIENPTSNILAQAKTGSGKTITFILPILHDMLHTDLKKIPIGIYALVLVPTRELALQIETVARSLLSQLKRSDINVACVIGGTNVKQEEQGLKAGGHTILIATPRRLLMTHMESGVANFSGLKHVVLDEADRLVDSGFEHDLRLIAQKFPTSSRRMLFSATMVGNVNQFANFLLGDKVLSFGLEETVQVNTLDQRYMIIDGNRRIATLLWFIKQDKFSKMIVFLTTNQNVKFMKKLLDAQKIDNESLNGTKNPKLRTSSFMRFLQDPKCKLLIATDVAARGLDFPNVDLVVQFELPQNLDDYFHRVGRSARAEKMGSALTFIASGEEQRVALPILQKAVHGRYGEEKKVDEMKIEDFSRNVADIQIVHKQFVDMIQNSKKQKPTNNSEKTLAASAEINVSICKRIHNMSGPHIRGQNQAMFVKEHRQSFGI